MNKKEYVKSLNSRISIVLDFLLREKKFKNNNQIAKTLGVPQSNLNAITKGERSLSIDKLVKLIIISDIDPNWLLTGRGEMFHSQNNQTDFSNLNINKIHGDSSIQKIDTDQYHYTKGGAAPEIVDNLKTVIEAQKDTIESLKALVNQLQEQSKNK